MSKMKKMITLAACRAKAIATAGMALGITAFAPLAQAEYTDNCITFSSAKSFSLKVANETASWDGTMWTSVDKTTWNEWDGTEVTAAQAGGTGDYHLYVRGDADNTTITENNSSNKWVLDVADDGKVACSGNIETLRGATGGDPSSTQMVDGCYKSMFEGCTALTAAPELPATTLADNCYEYMFLDCTALTDLPALPATTLAVSCYLGMFYGCTSLTNAPALPATTLAVSCYASMFQDCSALEVNATAPGKEWKLPSAEEATAWNNGMFFNTKGTVDVPKLDTTYYIASAVPATEAKIGDTYYATLDEAVAAAKTGETVELIKRKTYTLPKEIPNNIAITGAVAGVYIDATGTGNISSIPNGATFKNLAFTFPDGEAYRGFIHAGLITMEDCTISGFFMSYGSMTFKNSAFVQGIKEYCMWVYGGDEVTYDGCTFYVQGKCLNVYREGDNLVKLNVTNCTFNSTVLNKSAVNFKESSTSGEKVTVLNTEGILSDCTIGTPEFFPTDKVGGSPLYMIDDIVSTNGVKGGVKVACDGKPVWPLVAEVNGTKYPTLQAAVDATTEGDTVKLLQPCTADGVICTNSVTFDINGWDLTVETTFTSVTNLLLKNSVAGKGAFVVNGSVTVNGGTLDASQLNVDAGSMIRGEKGGFFVQKDATFAMMVDWSDYSPNYLAASKPGFLKAQTGGKVKMNIATYTMDDEGTFLFPNAGAKTTTTVDVDEGELTYGECYDTLQNAIKNAIVGATVKMLKDLKADKDTKPETEITIKKGQDILLDFNGYAIETEERQAINNKGTLTITNGNITAQESAIVFWGNSKTTISGGDYTSKDNAVLTGSGNQGEGKVTLTITGGTFNGNIESAGYIACGVYVPNGGTYEILGGTFNITGGCGVCARAGQVSIAKDAQFNLGGPTEPGKVGDSDRPVECVVAANDFAAGYSGHMSQDYLKAQDNTLTGTKDMQWIAKDADGYYTLCIPVTLETKDVENATYQVKLSGKAIEKTGEEYLIPTNNAPNAMVVYTANEGYIFEGDRTEIPCIVNAKKDPAEIQDVPESPDKIGLELGVVAQRYPWDGKVDAHYKTTNWPKEGAFGAVEITCGDVVVTNALNIFKSGEGVQVIDMKSLFGEEIGKAQFKAIVSTRPSGFAEVTKLPEGAFPKEIVDEAYELKAMDTVEGSVSPYASWDADLYISFDRDIAENTVKVAGQWGVFPWVPFELQAAMKAGEEIAFRKDLSPYNPASWNYCCKTIQTISSGVKNLSADNTGAKMKVVLRLTSNEKATKTIDITTIETTLVEPAEEPTK